MAGWGAKFIIIFLVVDIMLFTAGIGSPQLMGNYVNVNTSAGGIWYGSLDTNNTTISDLGLTTQLEGNASTNATVSGGRPSFWLWNTLSLVWTGLRSLVVFIFSPIYFLRALEAPLPITLLLGVVPSVGFIVAILSFIRGKDL